MTIPGGWTDDMRVRVRPGRTEAELVALVMTALIHRDDLHALVPIMQGDYGLSEGDVALAFDRIQGGIVRAITGNPENEPSSTKDPLAWHSFKAVWKDLPKRHWFSSRKKPSGPWFEWFEETRREGQRDHQQEEDRYLLSGDKHTVMTDKEFDGFVARCVDALKRKQTDLETRFGLGSFARWWFNQTTGLLQFFDSHDKVHVEAEVTLIGSFSTADKTWEWSWANPYVVDKQKDKSTKLRGLYNLTGMDVFRLELFEADEPMTWELAAMAVEHLGSLGCYRGPAGNTYLFLAIDALQVISSDVISG